MQFTHFEIEVPVGVLSGNVQAAVRYVGQILCRVLGTIGPGASTYDASQGSCVT